MPRLIATSTACLLAVSVAACGTMPTAGARPVARSRPVRGAGAAERVARAELMTVVHRIYAQALHGSNVATARRRLAGSTALAAAVAAHDARATRAALAPLLKHQIIRIDVTAGSRTLARMGRKPSFAPVHGVIRLRGRAVGDYVLTVTDDRAFTNIAHSLTGATVHFGRGGAAAIHATRFPAGRQRIGVTLPAVGAASGAGTAADARLLTIASVAQRVMAGEAHGASVAYDLRHAAADAGFRRAIATADPVGLRAAIIRFFRANLHIVRVRAWKDGRLIGDVGGPYVLSPASRSLPGGGRFMLAAQDDAGFIKIVHRFTGAAVVLHMGAKPVPYSTLYPGPAYQAGLGRTTYRGRTYRSFGFTGTAFPSGPLSVTLLVP